MNTNKTEQKQSRYRGLKPFKKGQSGNPKGRPKGSISITTEIKKKLEEIPAGEKRTYLEALILKILKKAIVDEDTQMIKNIWNYIDGMPKEKLEMGIEAENLKKMEQILRKIAFGPKKKNE